ncbi:hypothetical protein [Rodentibacter ratti]|uniref:hypothetical protein n=1 Tax=Rodentibacter ratti TaxID=1906745 RepID=UPI001C4DF0C4|nr:hypothetical protein [Rodentibacter ratti]
MKKIIFIVLLFIMMICGVAFSMLKPMPNSILSGEKEANPQVLNMQPLPENTPITRLVVMKSERQTWAYNQDKLVKIYPISLGKSPVGHKQFEGDKKHPRAFTVLMNAILIVVIIKI